MSSLFSANQLLRKASENTGLGDFGSEEFREGFDILVSSITARNEVPLDRYAQMEKYFLRLLMNRLWFAKDLADHPEIAEQELLPPVIISSLPRTGSTKLQRLLGATGNFQELLYWQGFNFARRPGKADEGLQQRINETSQHLQWRIQQTPDYFRGHEQNALEPDEDILLMDFSFHSGQLAIQFSTPEYFEWLAKTDYSYVYDYLCLQMKYLQWQFCPGGDKPWVSKCPAHLGREEQLDRIFPQGYYLVATHRKPDQIIPSGAKFIEYMQKEFYENSDAQLAANLIFAGHTLPVLKQMKWRETDHNAAILDLGFKEVTADSIAAAKKVMEFVGVTFDEVVEKGIREWDKEHRQHKFGKQQASLEEYGIEKAQIDEMMEPYLKAFAQYL